GVNVHFVNVSGTVAVDGNSRGGAGDTLTVVGRDGVADNTTIGPDPVYQGQVTIDPSLVPIRFQDIGALTVRTGKGAAAGDHLSVSPLGIPVSIDGQAAGTGPAGDILTLDSTGVSALRSTIPAISQEDAVLVRPDSSLTPFPPDPTGATGPVV